MATIAAVIASTHHPFYYRASTSTGADRPPFADEWVAKITPFCDANYYNEEREFGLPRMLVRGEEDLSAYLLRQGLDAGFDLAFSNELRIDHSVTCPLITLRPECDLPIVPVYTNIFAPPLPQPKRFVELGKAIRAIVESWPSDKRV